MGTTKSIMIVGVGGQGSLLASKLFGHVLLEKGYDVKVSEVHGMAQRGGSVVTYVKYGDQVYSPTVEEGEADVLLAFEKLEGARWLSFLKKGGRMILNTQRIDPMPVITGVKKYPENIEGKLADLGIDLIQVDALCLAEKAGTSKAVNVVMMGVLAAHLDIEKELWDKAVRECVPPRFMDLNLQAFQFGYQTKGE